MKIRITKKTKKIIAGYISILLIFFLIVEVLPKVTDIFETTQILKPGNLKLSYETTGYLIKDESVAVAPQSGSIEYLVEPATAVKKGFPVVKLQPYSEESSKHARFGEYTERLKGFDGVEADCNAPISGVVSYKIDGYENYFTPEKMAKIRRKTVEDLSYDAADLERKTVIKNEPVFKVSCDDIWYILCWVNEETAKTYSEGRDVIIELPEGNVEAEIYSVKKEEQDYRVIFELDVYYKAFAESRAEEISIVMSDNEGLLVDNECIIEKEGETGVYVVNKNSDYIFTPIKIIASDKKQSVIEDVTFYDEEGWQVYTVDVYDEVLKHPESALEKELQQEREEE